jgi:hypothetical protein
MDQSRAVGGDEVRAVAQCVGDALGFVVSIDQWGLVAVDGCADAR